MAGWLEQLAVYDRVDPVLIHADLGEDSVVVQSIAYRRAPADHTLQHQATGTAFAHQRTTTVAMTAWCEYVYVISSANHRWCHLSDEFPISCLTVAETNDLQSSFLQDLSGFWSSWCSSPTWRIYHGSVRYRAEFHNKFHCTASLSKHIALHC